MNKIKKWLIILALIVLIGSMFADKIIVFYIDLLWFEHLGFQSVLWTIIGSQFGLGILVALVFLALTYFPLKRIYDKTAHLPVLLSDEIRRDIVILELVGSNLKALLLFGPIVLAAMTGMVAAHDQMCAPVVLPNDRVPDRLSWTGHPHRQWQQR